MEVQGHRGARALRPENTLPGLAYALSLGVDAVEFDVTLTADDGLIVTHDLIVSPGTIRGPHLGRLWRELTLAQIATLDAGYRTPPEPFQDTFEPVPGTGVPQLGQVGRLITESGADHVTLAAELKTGPGWPAADLARLAGGALDTLDTLGLIGRSRILAFDWDALRVAREYAPDVPRVALVAPGTRPDGDLAAAAVAGPGADWLSPWEGMCDAALIGAAHDRGLLVSTWTVNEPGRMAELIDLGADAIVTDRPDLLRRVAAAAGLPLPAPCELPWPGGLPGWAPRSGPELQ